MKLHHWLALPFTIISAIFAAIAWQISGDKGQTFKEFVETEIA